MPLIFVLGLIGMAACRSGLASDIAAIGEPEVVFAWADDRCAANDIPDAPARAFRDEAGAIRLFAAHWSNRPFAGRTLQAIKRDCQIAFQGSENDDPGSFDDRIWLTSFWTADGKVVHALGHAEYHGHLRPTVCPAGRYMACWWNAVVQLISNDGGKTFLRVDGPEGSLVAALPTSMISNTGGRQVTSGRATFSIATATGMSSSSPKAMARSGAALACCGAPISRTRPAGERGMVRTSR